jgi:proto-oncogene tyrosine-protein kinase Ret
LTPWNVFLDNEFYPKIADFGLSQLIPPSDALIRSPQGCGTPLYMGVEMIEEDKDGLFSYGSPVDVYAWGMIFYQILTGKLPYADELATTAAEQQKWRIFNFVQKGTRPKRTVEILPEQWNLLMKCWDNNPQRRPTFQKIVADKEVLKLRGCDPGPFEDYENTIKELVQKIERSGG